MSIHPDNYLNYTVCKYGQSELTVTDGPASDLPQHQTEGPDVHPLIGIETVRLDGLIQNLWGHVALGSHFRIISHVQLIIRLCVCYCQTWRRTQEDEE